MSRTKHSSKGPGYEYWSRRHYILSPGRWSKMITHRYERSLDKLAVRLGLKEAQVDDADGSLPNNQSNKAGHDQRVLKLPSATQ